MKKLNIFRDNHILDVQMNKNNEMINKYLKRRRIAYYQLSIKFIFSVKCYYFGICKKNHCLLCFFGKGPECIYEISD